MRKLFPVFSIAFVVFLLIAGCASSSHSQLPQTLQITTTSLPSVQVGEIYAEQLTAVGGVAPYVWTVVSGSLPPGIALSQSGVLSGRPTVSGQYQLVIQVSDSALGENNLKSAIRIEWKTA
jgi:hypothetical protein